MWEGLPPAPLTEIILSLPGPAALTDLRNMVCVCSPWHQHVQQTPERAIIRPLYINDGLSADPSMMHAYEGLQRGAAPSWMDVCRVCYSTMSKARDGVAPVMVRHDGDARSRLVSRAQKGLFDVRSSLCCFVDTERLDVLVENLRDGTAREWVYRSARGDAPEKVERKVRDVEIFPVIESLVLTVTVEQTDSSGDDDMATWKEVWALDGSELRWSFGPFVQYFVFLNLQEASPPSPPVFACTTSRSDHCFVLNANTGAPTFALPLSTTSLPPHPAPSPASTAAAMLSQLMQQGSTRRDGEEDHHLTDRCQSFKLTNCAFPPSVYLAVWSTQWDTSELGTMQLQQQQEGSTAASTTAHIDIWDVQRARRISRLALPRDTMLTDVELSAHHVIASDDLGNIHTWRLSPHTPATSTSRQEGGCGYTQLVVGDGTAVSRLYADEGVVAWEREASVEHEGTQQEGPTSCEEIRLKWTGWRGGLPPWQRMIREDGVLPTAVIRLPLVGIQGKVSHFGLLCGRILVLETFARRMATRRRTGRNSHHVYLIHLGQLRRRQLGGHAAGQQEEQDDVATHTTPPCAFAEAERQDDQQGVELASGLVLGEMEAFCLRPDGQLVESRLDR
ncbi:unnamed protein product [Vitrella brassicaformis CCMP3155]|uniref:F-box domain-containing protein n=1 Tax=Vitrella brassicaformis (strain CCMP3155) TaxID=1169540 RepID=A0A0G4ETK5_VITBC|nr:unnamed protein product [Vitrella brassicaformis CCMP3155]|eukprot:CEM01572.1 unnamed protein product [Vitrella brassicaformis CCMP3155]